MTTTELPLESIIVGARHRKDMGDIDALAASIKKLGLLHAIVIRPDHSLVAGARRLEAVKRLGWEAVAVRIVHGLDEEMLALEAERDENTCRKDFTPLEAASMAKSLRPRVKKEADVRKQEGQKSGGRGKKKLEEKFSSSNGASGERARTQDKIAAAVGVSAPTLTKIEKVVEAAEAEPEKYGPVAEEMDRTGKVDAAYKVVNVKPRIVEAMDGGRWMSIDAIVKASGCKPEQFLNVFRMHKPSPKQPFTFQKNNEGKNATYRLLKTKNFLDPQVSHRLAQELGPLVKELVREATKHPTSISPVRLCELAQKIQKIIDSPSFTSVFSVN